MGPIRNNKKRTMEKKADDNPLVSGSSSEDFTEWWGILSKTVAGDPSCSRPLENFKNTFRMSKKCFHYICSLVKDHMMAKTHFAFSNGKLMSLYDQVALALTRLASGNSLISIGDLFGAHHSTVSQITWRFVEGIEEKGLHHLQWPSSEQEMTKIKQKFEKIRGLPNCCGAIDTTHITMLLTSSDQESETWLDQKQNHSMILQAIVGPDMRFLSVVTGWPGKMSDSSVLRTSNIFKLCENGRKLDGPKIRIFNETELGEYIIGDSGFPLLPWLLTPYQGKELPENEAEFNNRLLATHSVSQKALVRLKDVWRMIHGEMWRPDKHKLPRFILVCCILHNIVIEMDGLDELLLSAQQQHDPGYRQQVCESVDEAGLVVRDKLCMYFSG